MLVIDVELEDLTLEDTELTTELELDLMLEATELELDLTLEMTELELDLILETTDELELELRLDVTEELDLTLETTELALDLLEDETTQPATTPKGRGCVPHVEGAIQLLPFS